MKPEEDFPVYTTKRKNKEPTKYLYKICRECKKKRQTDWLNQKSPEYKESLRIRGINNNLMRLFSITYQDYLKMVESQNNKCYICGNEDKEQRLSVDHCHTTGKIRKLLCKGCNVALGHSKENVKNLENMIKYLKEHNQTS